jgi:hypothetical protein
MPAPVNCAAVASLTSQSGRPRRFDTAGYTAEPGTRRKPVKRHTAVMGKPTVAILRIIGGKMGYPGRYNKKITCIYFFFY